MRRFVSLVVGLFVVAFAGVAFSQSDDGADEDPRQKFYIFDGDEVSGETDGPDVVDIQVRGDVEFDSLLELERKSFLDGVEQSGEDGGL